MPNFDLTTTDGIGLFFQIFASGFAFLQIYRIFRKIEKPMSEIQWFGNSLLLSLFVITLTGYLVKQSPAQLQVTETVPRGMSYIVFGLIFGFISAQIINSWTWVFNNRQEIWKLFNTNMFKKKTED